MRRFLGKTFCLGHPATERYRQTSKEFSLRLCAFAALREK
jgi:hypothetical protein